MEQIEANGWTFDYVSGGEGEPIVLLHGFPESAASWNLITPALHDAGFCTFAPNQRGYSPGARPEGVEHYAVPHLATDVIALADAWGLNKFHLVGHDWGSAVAWYTAAHYPERIRSLTAVSVPHLAAFGWALLHDADQQQRSAYIGLFREPGKAEEVLLANNGETLGSMFGDSVAPELHAEHTALLTQPGALTAALNWYRAMGADLGELPPVTVTTTYVWSTGDIALGRAGAERCAEFVNAPYSFIELEGISHWIPEEAPAALARAITTRAKSTSNETNES